MILDFFLEAITNIQENIGFIASLCTIGTVWFSLLMRERFSTVGDALVIFTKLVSVPLAYYLTISFFNWFSIKQVLPNTIDQLQHSLTIFSFSIAEIWKCFGAFCLLGVNCSVFAFILDGILENEFDFQLLGSKLFGTIWGSGLIFSAPIAVKRVSDFGLIDPSYVIETAINYPMINTGICLCTIVIFSVSIIFYEKDWG